MYILELQCASLVNALELDSLFSFGRGPYFCWILHIVPAPFFAGERRGRIKHKAKFLLPLYHSHIRIGGGKVHK